MSILLAFFFPNYTVPVATYADVSSTVPITVLPITII
jgi:hypothetical protein